MIVRLSDVGFASNDVSQVRRVFRDLFGLESRAEQADPLIGVDRAASIPFPNECSLYVMESRDTSSNVYRYLQERGPGLERIVLVTDTIQEEYERIRDAGAELIGDGIMHTPKGYRLIISLEHELGMIVELVQPGERIHDFDSLPIRSGVMGLQHIGVAVRDLDRAGQVFKELLDLELRDVRTDQHGGEQRDGMIEPGNDRLWLHLTESFGANARVRRFLEQNGPGLEHITIEVSDIRDAVRRVTGRGIPIHDHKIYTNREDGFEAFVYPEYTGGVTVELIEPFPTSRGYRVRGQ